LTVLPAREHVFVAEAKCSNYLLALSHPDGGSKAKFFYEHGFNSSEWATLQAALKRHPLDNEVFSSRRLLNPDGTARVHYEVRCNIETPNGKLACIKTIWAIHENNPAPQFVTAYPA